MQKLILLLRSRTLSPSITFQQALQLCNKGRHADAVPLLQAIVEHDSEQLPVRETLAQVLAHLGRTEEAISVYQNILRSDSHKGNRNALLGLANCLSHLGDRNGALNVLERLLDFDPINMQALVTKGQIQTVELEYHKAIETFRMALKIDPRDTNARAGLLNAVSGTSSREKSSEHLQALLAMVPGDYQVWRTFGRLVFEIETTPPPGFQHAACEEKSLNRVGSWEPSKPMRLHEQLDQEPDVYSAQLSWFRGSIDDLRSTNTECAKLIASQESKLGFLESYKAAVLYGHTQQYMRNMSLFREKFGDEPRYLVAPAEIPEDRLSGFTMNGRVPVERAYLNAVYPDRYADIISDNDINKFSQMVTQQLVATEPSSFLARSNGAAVPLHLQAGLDPHAMPYASIYGPTDGWLVHAFERHRIDGLRVAIYGSINPFHETICLMAGAKPTTIRRRPIINRTNGLKTMTIMEWEADPVDFDAALAISCLEHEGLGMLGEPIDPDADRDAMQRLQRIVKPQGLLFVAVPIGLDRVMFNSTRVYGEIRLPVLFQGWTIIARYGYGDQLLEGNGETQPVFVLRKE